MRRTEWRVLFNLGRDGPMTATQLGRLAHTHKTKVSRAVRGAAGLPSATCRAQGGRGAGPPALGDLIRPQGRLHIE
nr:MarR family transcriptional regulator [Rhodovulum sp. ES.010]